MGVRCVGENQPHRQDVSHCNRLAGRGKSFHGVKMSNPWTNRNKFTFDTRGLAIYVDMTEQQVRDERKKNYEDSQVPVPENRKEQ